MGAREPSKVSSGVVSPPCAAPWLLHGTACSVARAGKDTKHVADGVGRRHGGVKANGEEKERGTVVRVRCLAHGAPSPPPSLLYSALGLPAKVILCQNDAR